jgi:NAD-dependent deacetylase
MELVRILRDFNHIVFMGGAGVSTESGIPDFRSENGIYSTVKKFGEPPERILSKSFFWGHTDIFFDYYRYAMIHPNAMPNDAHFALAELEKLGKLDAVITQNIDGLHQIAGSKHVLELHGSIHSNHCTGCGQFYSLEQMLETQGVPRCKSCGQIVKPDVVLYEEALDETVLNESSRAVSEAEVLIVGGTSLNVYLAASLLNYFKGKYLVLINKGETPFDRTVDLLIRENIGTTLKDAMASIATENCVQCNICIEVCPVAAIDELLLCDSNTCIKCFACVKA